MEIECPNCKEKVAISKCQAAGCQRHFIAAGEKAFCSQCFHSNSTINEQELSKKQKMEKTCPNCNMELEF